MRRALLLLVVLALRLDALAFLLVAQLGRALTLQLLALLLRDASLIVARWRRRRNEVRLTGLRRRKAAPAPAGASLPKTTRAFIGRLRMAVAQSVGAG